MYIFSSRAANTNKPYIIIITIIIITHTHTHTSQLFIFTLENMVIQWIKGNAKFRSQDEPLRMDILLIKSSNAMPNVK